MSPGATHVPGPVSEAEMQEMAQAADYSWTSVFGKMDEKAYPHRFAGTLHVTRIAGGVPNNPKVAEGHIRSKIEAKDDTIRRMVAELMVERRADLESTEQVAEKISDEELVAFAVEHLNEIQNVNGFRRDDKGLYISGFQLKAAIKEAAMVAGAAGKIEMAGWGKTRKGLKSFVAEHIIVVEDKLHLRTHQADSPVSDPSGYMLTDKPTDINQRFVNTWRGNSIAYEEYVENCLIDFTVITDWDFTDEQWAMIWLTGQHQGIGATRSQGYGEYQVIRWDRLS